jgi:hypothetical protein
MEQERIDGDPVERVHALAHVLRDAARAAVGEPRAAVATHPALGDHAHVAFVSARDRRAQHARDETLVVSQVARIEPVGMCGVDHGEPGVERRTQRRLRALVVAVTIGREPHASERDAHGRARKSTSRDA